MAHEEDIAQSVLRCLYEGAARGQFATVVNRQELGQLLTNSMVAFVGGITPGPQQVVGD